jgi:large subunit ribosomal protein L4
MNTELYNTKGEAAGKVELPEAVFGLKPSKGFLLEAVTAHLANQRDGQANTKTRSEVSGGGKKPWKQKHTGRARSGSNRSPLWRKGGIVFGPKPRSYRQGFSKQKAMLALGQALSAKLSGGKLQIVESFDVAEPKTKLVAQLLEALKWDAKNTLVVTDAVSAKLKTAARNVRGLALERGADLHAYEVLAARKLVVTKAGLEQLLGRWKGN